MAGEKGELLWEQTSKTVTTSIREISQTGIKLEFNYHAKLHGRLTGQQMGTVTITANMDGTSEWEDKAMGTTPDGEMFVFTGRGRGKRTGPTTTSWEGEVNAMSASPKLAWLSGTKIVVTGTGDQSSGEASAKFYQRK